MAIKGPYCPATMKPACIDDMCRGGGCMEMQGAELVYYCTDCGEETMHDHCFCTEEENRDLEDDDF